MIQQTETNHPFCCAPSKLNPLTGGFLQEQLNNLWGFQHRNTERLLHSFTLLCWVVDQRRVKVKVRVAKRKRQNICSARKGNSLMVYTEHRFLSMKEQSTQVLSDTEGTKNSWCDSLQLQQNTSQKDSSTVEVFICNPTSILSAYLYACKCA